jgi:hypothetical protein
MVFIYGSEKIKFHLFLSCNSISILEQPLEFQNNVQSHKIIRQLEKKNCSKYTVRKPVYSEHIGVNSKSQPLSCLEATASTKLMAFSILIGHNLRRLQDRVTIHSKTRHTACY